MPSTSAPAPAAAAPRTRLRPQQEESVAIHAAATCAPAERSWRSAGRLAPPKAVKSATYATCSARPARRVSRRARTAALARIGTATFSEAEPRLRFGRIRTLAHGFDRDRRDGAMSLVVEPQQRRLGLGNALQHRSSIRGSGRTRCRRRAHAARRRSRHHRTGTSRSSPADSTARTAPDAGPVIAALSPTSPARLMRGCASARASPAAWAANTVCSARRMPAAAAPGRGGQRGQAQRRAQVARHRQRAAANPPEDAPRAHRVAFEPERPAQPAPGWQPVPAPQPLPQPDFIGADLIGLQQHAGEALRCRLSAASCFNRCCSRLPHAFEVRTSHFAQACWPTPP